LGALKWAHYQGRKKSIRGFLLKLYATNANQAGVLVNHEAKLKGGCEGE